MTISILMPKVIIIKYLPSVSSKFVPKFKNAQNLSKFGRFDILDIPISILMSRMVFMKYLAAVRSNSPQNQNC